MEKHASFEPVTPHPPRRRPRDKRGDKRGIASLQQVETVAENITLLFYRNNRERRNFVLSTSRRVDSEYYVVRAIATAAHAHQSLIARQRTGEGGRDLSEKATESRALQKKEDQEPQCSSTLAHATATNEPTPMVATTQQRGESIEDTATPDTAALHQILYLRSRSESAPRTLRARQSRSATTTGWPSWLGLIPPQHGHRHAHCPNLSRYRAP